MDGAVRNLESIFDSQVLAPRGITAWRQLRPNQLGTRISLVPLDGPKAGGLTGWLPRD
jgi:hypothetical protein